MKAKKLGICAVDSGTIMVGDPCYFITENPPYPSWENFLNETDYARKQQLKFNLGHDGLGVVAGTKYGDGEYPVYEITDGHGGQALVVVTAGNPLHIPNCEV